MAIDKIGTRAADLENLEIAGTEAARMPAGTTAEREGSPKIGDLRFNTTLDQLEQYTSDGWKGISAPPTITSIDQSNLDTTSDPFTLVITGQNFDATATATLADNNSVTLTATSSTRNSSSQITLVYGGSELSAIDANTPEPLIVKVTNGSGLTATLEGSLGVDDNPVWSSPAANSNQNLIEEESATIALSATDPETGGSITYSISSGTLPGSLSLSGSNITGTVDALTGTYSSAGVSTPITITATGADGDTTNRTFNIVRKWKDGSTQSQAVTSATELTALGITTDGTFWLQPTGCPNPFEVHCFNSIEGGGWMLAYRTGTNLTNTYGATDYPSGTFGVSNWTGWGHSTQSVIDNHGGNNDYSVRADNDAQSPIYAYSQFTDVMVISNRTGKESKRTGHRFPSTISSMVSVINTSSETRTTNVLFGSLQWLQVLDIKSDLGGPSINTFGGADYVAFKARSDSGSTTNTSNYTGGFHTSTMHYGSQFGTGRDNTDGSKWGGGFGGNYSNSSYHKMHGHWWGHGKEWSSGSGQQAEVFYGHSIYVRMP